MPEENSLTQREEEILQLVATGLTNREIAQALQISPNTVKVHLSNIFEKAGVASRTEATLYGMEHGIVQVPGGENGVGGVGILDWRALARHFRWVWVALGLLLVVISISLAGNVFLPAPVPESAAMPEAASRWQELAPMPAPRAAMAAAAYDGKIYAIAGEGPEGVRGDVFRYLPEEDRWETLNAKPTAVADVAGAVIGEKIYIPGGRLADGGVTDILEIYDPRQDTWTQGAPLPKPVSAYALADFEGRLYLFGGWDGVQALADVWVYDPGTDAWQAGTGMRTARRDAGAVALADKIVVLGGRNEADVLKSVVSYLPSRDGSGEDPWDAFVDMPINSHSFGVASSEDTIYLIGEDSEISHNELSNQTYQFSDGLWHSQEIITLNQILNPELIFYGSNLFILTYDESENISRVWSYRAYYYEIFFPLVE